VPRGDEQVGLTGPGVADQAQRLPLADPLAGGEGGERLGGDARVGLEVEGPQFLLPREAGSLDPAFGAASAPVVAFGHQQLGEEPAVSHLLPGGGLGEVGELGPQGRQAQDPAGGVDRGVGGGLGQAAVALDGHS
jgi:hypothetical protein